MGRVNQTTFLQEEDFLFLIPIGNMLKNIYIIYLPNGSIIKVNELS